jgi:hypothetical protein
MAAVAAEINFWFARHTSVCARVFERTATGSKEDSPLPAISGNTIVCVLGGAGVAEP